MKLINSLHPEDVVYTQIRQLRFSISYQLYSQLWDRGWDQVDNGVWDQVRELNMEKK